MKPTDAVEEFFSAWFKILHRNFSETFIHLTRLDPVVETIVRISLSRWSASLRVTSRVLQSMTKARPSTSCSTTRLAALLFDGELFGRSIRVSPNFSCN